MSEIQFEPGLHNSQRTPRTASYGYAHKLGGCTLRLDDLAILGGRAEKTAQTQERIKELVDAPNRKAFALGVVGVAAAYASHAGLRYGEVIEVLNGEGGWQADYTKIEGRQVMSQMDAIRCLMDITRTHQLAKGIKETVGYLKRQKVGPLTAIDAGAGSGILSMFLATCGVDKVIAIELNAETAATTRAFVKEAGLDDSITVLHGDATDIDLPLKEVDILVSENLSSGLMDEPQYDIIAHLSRFLAPDAQILPYSAQLKLTAAYADWSELPYSVYNARKLKEYWQFVARAEIAKVDSEVGMQPPVIDSTVELALNGETHQPPLPVNTLAISSCFQINKLGRPRFLLPAVARFLGSMTAFRLPDERATDTLEVSLNYRAGCRKSDLEVTQDGNRVSITEP